MNLTWKDATSYSKGQRGKVAQTAWQAEIGEYKILVSRGHINHPERWVMTCRKLGLEAVDLSESKFTPEHAQKLALSKVWEVARSQIAELESFSDTAFAEMA